MNSEFADMPSPAPHRTSVAGDLARLRRHGRYDGITLAEAGTVVAQRSTPLPLLFLGLLGLIPSPGLPLGLLTRDGLGALTGHFVGIASTALFVMLGLGLFRAGTDLFTLLPW